MRRDLQSPGSSHSGSDLSDIPLLSHHDHSRSRGPHSPPRNRDRDRVMKHRTLGMGRISNRWWFRFSVLLNILGALWLTHSHSEVLQNAQKSVMASWAEEPAPQPLETETQVEKWTPGMEGGQCSLCAVNPALCEELGPENAIRALGYRGQNARMRRMLAKLRAGKPFNMAVIGGSVSVGYGIHVHNASTSTMNMHRIVFDHLNARFPGKADPVFGSGETVSAKHEGRNGFSNAALRATGTDYFQYCLGDHVTDDVDLVLVEQAINDGPSFGASRSYEQLVRSLIELPGEPAVINIHVFALIFGEMARGGDVHMGVAEFYDIPTISMRNLFLPQIFEDSNRIMDLFVKFDKKLEGDKDTLDNRDTRHVSQYVHRIAGNLTSAYIDMQLCEMDRIEAEAGHSRVDELYPKPKVPRQKLWDKFDVDKTLPPFRPQCASMNSRRNPFKPTENKGWREWFRKDVPEKKYMVADKPGSSISAKFTTTMGIVELYHLASREFGLGSVECWVDNAIDRRVRIDGYWGSEANIGRTQIVRSDLTPGEHEIHCKLLDSTRDPGGGKEFRIIGVMSV